jgi:phage gp36-like protein
MNYCSYTDLVERFGSLELDQLTNHSGDCPAIQSAIADAASEIDSYVGRRYTLPLNIPIPVILRRCACDIARYYLWDLQVMPPILARYQDAIATLKSIAQGSIVLEVAPTIEPTRDMVQFIQEDRNVWQRERKYASPRLW